VDAGAKRILRFVRNAIRTELELDALQAGIGIVGIHEEIVELRF
jgi:hypothetical protein